MVEKWSADESTMLSDDANLSKYNLVLPSNLVTMARLQLFGRVALKAPKYVLKVLAAAIGWKGANTWMQAVLADIGYI